MFPIFLLGAYIKKRLTKVNTFSSAFTLIELIITIGVFSVGVLAAFSLAIGNSNDNRANKDRIIAANLSREALELTRNIRDSNWLRLDNNVYCDGGATICSWDDMSLTNKFILVDYNNYGAGVNVCAAYGSLEECLNNCKNNNSCLMYIDAGGFYSHDNTGIATNFYRAVGLEEICLNTTTLVETVRDICQATEEKIGLEASSRVDWKRSNKDYSLELSDRFYNWRR
jgi:prepilin-type N-terminal cleavage/methylation domain-containing protein